MQYLLHKAPKTISLRDPATGLYPFMIAHSCENSCVNVVYELLQMDPSLLTIHHLEEEARC